VIYMNNNMKKSLTGASIRNIFIRTQQGEVEITGTHHEQPGVCPHCHREIPLSSVVFKKMDINNNVFTFTGKELAAEYGITIGQKNKAEATDQQQNKPGECPYCHEQIPINEIMFREYK